MPGGRICIHFDQVSSKLSVSKLKSTSYNSLLRKSAIVSNYMQMMAMCWWLAASFFLFALRLETTLAEEGN